MAIGLLAAGHVVPSVVSAQTDYFNTDAGRPIRIEDAYAIERRAIELQVAPLRLERPRSGSYRWGFEPEVALGLLPRTQVEIGFPLVHSEAPASGGAGRAVRTTGLAGLELSALYNLNAETRLPALAVVGDVVLPVGGFGPARAVPSLKGVATKTFAWARFHVNAQYTFGDADAIAPSAGGALPAAPVNAEFTRWLAGVAIDRTLPLKSLLLTAEVVTSTPLDDADLRQWDGAGGVRYQLSPRIAFDAGGGYRFRGDDAGWFMTTGAAVAIGFPNGRRWR
jgi:hypothetical protein